MVRPSPAVGPSARWYHKQSRGFRVEKHSAFSRQPSDNRAAFSLPTTACAATVALFPIPPRTDPLLSSKSVALFFKSAELSAVGRQFGLPLEGIRQQAEGTSSSILK